MRDKPDEFGAMVHISPDNPVIIEAKDGSFFATTIQCRSDSAGLDHMERAEMIVRAVNSYGKSRAVIAALTEVLEEFVADCNERVSLYGTHGINPGGLAIRTKAIYALAAAKEDKP